MRGEPQSSRMGDAMCISDKKVRDQSKSFTSRQNQRDLSKRQKPRYIGEFDPPFDYAPLDKHKVGETQNNHCCLCHPSLVLMRDVRACNETRDTDLALPHYLRGKRTLNLPSFSGTYMPAMKVAPFHITKLYPGEYPVTTQTIDTRGFITHNNNVKRHH